MADIKGLDIFGNNNRGLDRIKKEAAKKKVVVKEEKPKEEVVKEELVEVLASPTKIASIEKSVTPVSQPSTNFIGKKKGAGAPIRQFDKVYSAKHPIKLSTLLNATSRVLVEKYETSMTRDEILRKALDEYIKQNLTQEDKRDLLNDVTRELDLFREKFPIIPETDSLGMVIRTEAQIKEETEETLKDSWGMNHKTR